MSFNFVPFKLLINVHSKLSKATTFGKSCPGQNSFFFKNLWSIHIKERKRKTCPSSQFVMLTGVFRKRSLRGNRSGFLRMKRVVWLNCIITFDNSHTFYKVYFLFFNNQNVWGIIVWLYTEVLTPPSAFMPAGGEEKPDGNNYLSNIGKQSHQLFSHWMEWQKNARKRLVWRYPHFHLNYIWNMF